MSTRGQQVEQGVGWVRGVSFDDLDLLDACDVDVDSCSGQSALSGVGSLLK